MIETCPCTFGLALPLATAGATSAALRRAIARLDGRRVARDVQADPGRSACGTVGSRCAAVGSQALFDRLGWPVPGALAADGALPVNVAEVVSYVGWDGMVHGAIAAPVQPRAGRAATIDHLRRRGRVVLLAGAASAEGDGSRFGEVFAGVPPEAKAATACRLCAHGRVATVGEGSNDALALAGADLACAFGAPTTLAAQAAAIVVAGERIERVDDTARRRLRRSLARAHATRSRCRWR